MRILFVAEPASPHAARWIEMASAAQFKTSLFHATAAPTIYSKAFEDFRGPVYSFRPIAQAPQNRFLISDYMAAEFETSQHGIYPVSYSNYLIEAIEEFRPDIVHVLGLCVNFNNSVRILNRAWEGLKDLPRPKLMYSSWGADLDYYPHAYPSEREEIQKFLSRADYYIAECHRDVRLASAMGFKGQTMVLLPASGGFEVEKYLSCVQKAPDERKFVVIKGRDEVDGDPVGRAMVILDALDVLATEKGGEIREFKYRIFQASPTSKVARRAEDLRAKHKLDIAILGSVTDKDLFDLFGSSRLFVAHTINDGLPLSVVESIALGALPIHSDLESLRDYIETDVNGILTPIGDVRTLAEAIHRGLNDAELFVRARQKNRSLVRDSLARDIVSRRAIRIYRKAVRWGTLRHLAFKFSWRGDERSSKLKQSLRRRINSWSPRTRAVIKQLPGVRWIVRKSKV